MDRARILLCGHPNVAGCPNHGDIAREVIDALRHERVYDETIVLALGEDDTVPIPYELTEKALEMLAWERGEIWYPF